MKFSGNKNTRPLSLSSPAKVNLMLSVHGKRPDGFHSLTSLVVALEFADRLLIRRAESDVLRCSDPAVPRGPENLILQAAAVLRERLGRPVYFEFELEKRIPMGAGLGGGSGNAAVALKGMNALLGKPLETAELSELAAQIGSDCPFFIESRPAVIRGRGERIELLPEAAAARLRGRGVVLFRPDFGIETAWAYGRLAAGAPAAYEEPEAAERRLEAWSSGGDPADLLENSFEAPIGTKYLALSTLLAQLRGKGVPCLMSGSGSCCFALLSPGGLTADEISGMVQAAWGDSVFWVETSID